MSPTLYQHLTLPKMLLSATEELNQPTVVLFSVKTLPALTKATQRKHHKQ